MVGLGTGHRRGEECLHQGARRCRVDTACRHVVDDGIAADLVGLVEGDQRRAVEGSRHADGLEQCGQQLPVVEADHELG